MTEQAHSCGGEDRYATREDFLKDFDVDPNGMNGGTLKALVLNAIGEGFDFEDVDIGTPMGREVLVNVQASGLCHTNLLFALTISCLTQSALWARGRGDRDRNRP